jgi:hypothetical protein
VKKTCTINQQIGPQTKAHSSPLKESKSRKSASKEPRISGSKRIIREIISASLLKGSLKTSKMNNGKVIND